MTTALLVAVALAALGVLVALWQRSEAQASAAAEVLAQAQLAAAKREAEGEAGRHADEVRRLEVTICDLRAEIKERDDEIEALLSDDPAGAGEHLASVLSDVPTRDPGDGAAVLQPAAGAAGGGGRSGGGRI